MPPIGTSLLLKILGGALALAALIWVVQSRNHWKAVAGDRQEQLAALCLEVRSAAGNPKLDCKRAGEQVRSLGRSLAATTQALERQNARVAALGAETARQQKSAAEAARKAEERSRSAERTRAALETSARSGGPGRAPCEPSETVKRNWQ